MGIFKRLFGGFGSKKKARLSLRLVVETLLLLEHGISWNIMGRGNHGAVFVWDLWPEGSDCRRWSG